MKPPLETAIHLLHAAAAGTLATHSLQLPGYPFASAVPFVADERHCPVFLMSGLAEHTRNLAADGRTSFLVGNTDGTNVLAGARMTLAGDAVRIDAAPELVSRYLRYQPDAEHYLNLGGFAFNRLTPQRVRFIAGFGHMGWIEGEEWTTASALPLSDEADWLLQLAGTHRPGVRLLGADCYGCDIEQQGQRQRIRFGDIPIAPQNIGESIKRLLATL